ncbi:protein arginine kinase [candidate division WOR-3 bacterium]|uniref:Protein-arginine kinase n=1 Tax=candidate division WOR-3 bacterium TaxID=2052148 RepID=A0A938BSE2_UNCW3|nr:protein arginine kinase [candidate division WOR-3 bacterium]
MSPGGSVGKWLAASGPEADVVLSTRVRLARNLADVPFTHRAEPRDHERTVDVVRWALTDTGYLENGKFLQNEQLADPQCQYLIERHLASPDFIASKAKRGFYVGNDEATSLMINEEDHLRFQVMASGLDFPEAFTAAAALDEKLESQLQYAFSPEFGFLTACPTNLGTGMRASVLVHLPALVITREIEKVLRGAIHIGLAVRGLYGEGTETKGNFFQISNQKTVGQTEWEIIETIADISRQVILYERKAREYLMKKLRVEVEDKVFRSLGLLRGARVLSSDEAINLIAGLRLGVTLGIVNEISLEQVTRLMILVRPANLQALLGENLTAAERDERRATFVRETLVHP